ncbi:uncharacterized protein LOC112494504 isoform X2 [Cephus cinctus]|nr:uncharacterized protein LOC112494504 isoform X2 [Cephus cinctus]
MTITKAYQNLIFLNMRTNLSSDDFSEDEQEFPREFIAELKQKFNKPDITSQEKVRILTLLPKSWNINKDQLFPKEIKQKIQHFYENDDVSTMMPGQKDTKSVKINGESQVRQKRLIMGNPSLVYKNFKKENLDVKIGFSKFCSFRPTYCILAISGGTHTVCVSLA